MRNLLELVKFRDSVEYRPMFRTIIKFQIQALIIQLANAGEESVLLTACMTENVVVEDDAVASELGQVFLQDRPEFLSLFREFCNIKTRQNETVNEPNNKRKQSDGIEEPTIVESTSNDGFVPDGKRIKMENTNNPDSGNDSRDSTSDVTNRSDPAFYSPRTPGTSISSPYKMGMGFKGQNMTTGSSSAMNSNFKNYHKCSQCSYMSKFKANVARHERSIHGINVDGAASPTIQYACTLCTYKSIYRSNLMRHEKNIHKMEPLVPDPGDPSLLGAQWAGGDQVSTIPSMTNTESANSKNSDKQFEGPTHEQKATDDTENGQDSANGCHVCGFCQLIFPTIQLLKDHVDTAHYGMGGRYDCGKCRTSFSNLAHFQNHMMNHYLPRQEKCVCGRTFQYRVSLLKHIPKCVIAKETNFKMSDIVLGSGLDIESGHGRTEPEPGTIRADLEQGARSKSMSELGTNMCTDQGQMNRDLEQVNIKEEIDEGTIDCSTQVKENQTTELGHRKQSSNFDLGDSISELGTNKCAEEGSNVRDFEQVNIKQEVDAGTIPYSMQGKENETAEMGHSQQDIDLDYQENER